MIALRIPDRVIGLVKWVGYPLFATSVFLLSLYFTLPRDRIRDRLESEATGFLGVDVKASDDFGLTLLGGPGFTTSQVILKTRPVMPNDKPVRYSVDDLTIHFSPIQLLRGFADVSYRGKVAGGQVSGKYKATTDETVVVLDAADLAIGDVAAISTAVGLPLEGAVDLKVDVTAQKGVIAQSNGSATLTVTDAVVGDGKAKLIIPGGDPFLSQGITVPKIQLGKIAGKVSIEKGRATLHELRGHSKDIDVELDGTIDLRDPVSLSILHLYLKVKPSDALLKREATLELLVNGAGAMARRSDGFLGFSIAGTLGSPFPMPAKEAPIGNGSNLAPSVPRFGGAMPSPPPMRFGNLPRPAGVTTTIDVPPSPPPLPPPPPYVPEYAPPPASAPPPTPIAPVYAVPSSTMHIGSGGSSERSGGTLRPMEGTTSPEEGGRGSGEAAGDQPVP